MSFQTFDNMGNGSSVTWQTTYLTIKNKHDHAFKVIEEAISFEEQEKPYEAIEKYKQGIHLIDEILHIPVECPEHPDEKWNNACEMIQKIKRTRAEVLTRINCTQSSPGFTSLPLDQPPSYEEAMSSTSDDSLVDTHHITYKDLATALEELSIDPNQHLNEEIVYMHPGVRLYFISPNGEVVSTREPQLLKISLVEGSEVNAPKAILQIGDWIYPLIPGVSPCYRTDYGAFILPDVYSDVPGSSVGIILPSDADADVFDLLESILHGIITQETEQEIYNEKRRRLEETEDTSAKISNKLVNGAWYISEGLIKGAHKAEELINKSTPTLINNMSHSNRRTEVPHSVSKSVKIAENATSKAVKVTGFIAEKVGQGTMKLGHYLAPHIQKQGTKLLRSGFHMSETEASEKMKSILTVAAGAVEGFTTVYRGLETSAGILGRSLKDNTVKVVEHKYGPSAAQTTEDSLNTMGNAYATYQNTRIFKPSRLVKNTAKEAGRGMVQSYSTTHSSSQSLRQSLDAGPSRVYPELTAKSIDEEGSKTSNAEDKDKERRI